MENPISYRESSNNEPGEVNLKKRKYVSEDPLGLGIDQQPSTSHTSKNSSFQLDMSKSSSNSIKHSSNTTGLIKNKHPKNSSTFLDEFVVSKSKMSDGSSASSSSHYQRMQSEKEDEMNYEIEASFEFKREQQRAKDELLLRQQINYGQTSGTTSQFMFDPSLSNKSKHPKPNDSSSFKPSKKVPGILTSNTQSATSSDSETIFTPIITPVNKKSKQVVCPSDDLLGSVVSPTFGHTARSNPLATFTTESMSRSERMKIIGVQVIDQVTDQMWVCPACNSDRKSPMICCDSCDDWYHW